MTVQWQALLLAVCLAGCASEQERAQNIAASDDWECKSYGASPGTPAYMQCRMAKDQQRQQNQAALTAAYLGSRPQPYVLPQPQPYYMPPNPAPYRGPTNCITNRSGQTLYTNCN